MLQQRRRNVCVFVVKTAILFYGIMHSKCQITGEKRDLPEKNTLILITKELNKSYCFPTKVLYHEVTGRKVCFIVQAENLTGDCCDTDFNCDIDMRSNASNIYGLTMDKETLSKQNVVLMKALGTMQCKPSQLFENSSGFLSAILKILGTEYELLQDDNCKKGSAYDSEDCKGVAETKYKFIVGPGEERRCVSCEPPETTSTMIPSTPETTSTMIPTTTKTTSTMIPTTPETTSTTIPTTTKTTSTMIPTTTETTSTMIPTPETTSTMIPTTTETTSTMIPTTPETTSTMIPTPETTSTMIPTTETTSTMIPTTTETTSTMIPTPETTSTMIPTTETTSTMIPTTESNNIPSFQNALNIMNNLSSIAEQLELSAVVNIAQDDIKGVITKLPSKAQTDIDIGITTSGDVSVVKDDSNLQVGFYRRVHIPKDVIKIASQKRNNSFVGVVLFPGMHQDDPSSAFVKDEVVGIEMGTEISNLSQTIDIHYTDVDKNGFIASCRSWDGKGEVPIWVTDGCLTTETNNSITCQCSHLTFFAILLSPPPQNISSSDFTALTYITSIGCGLSIFFLTVALFTHFLLRKEKATHATKIMINLFVAVLTLNLSFLVNESVANLKNLTACLAMAAATHYAMLATFTWFFIEALHLYLTIWKLPTEIKHYMIKVCAAGWGIPSIVVVVFLIFRKYDYVAINTDDGNSVKMCWIPDEAVHQGVNIGYYAVVFTFTFTVFIATMQRMITLHTKAGKDQGDSSIKIKSLSIFGLFLLLGITWVFAFFSFGPLLIPSYYIFTVLNSFQGFGLFIYYCRSRRSAGKDTSISDGSTATSNTGVKAL